MDQRIGDRKIRNGLGMVIVAMALSAVRFILAGSVDPRVHRERIPHVRANGEVELGEPICLSAVAAYPVFAVTMSCSLVLAEGMVLWQLLTRLKTSMVVRALASCLAAGGFAAEIKLAELGIGNPPGYVTYHSLWLVCATALMLALLLVAVANFMFRRFTSRAPAKAVEADDSAAGASCVRSRDRLGGGLAP